MSVPKELLPHNTDLKLVVGEPIARQSPVSCVSPVSYFSLGVSTAEPDVIVRENDSVTDERRIKSAIKIRRVLILSP